MHATTKTREDGLFDLAGQNIGIRRQLEHERGFLYSVALAALRNCDDAQDVSQEALVYAHMRVAELRDPTRLRAWLRQIALSLCADYRRRPSTRPLGTALNTIDERSEDIDFADRLAFKQKLARLSEDHRTTLMMHYVGGWSLTEIADLMQAPLNTVRSRLMAGKRYMRGEAALRGRYMKVEDSTLSSNQKSLILSAFPGSEILSVEQETEPWSPFAPRVHLRLADGSERTVDFRTDIDPATKKAYGVLDRLGIPCPRIISGPVGQSDGTYLTLTEVPRGENLLLWTLGGTPHRIRLATERAFQVVDRLHGATDALRADPVSSMIPTRTLSDEVDLMRTEEQWRTIAWFTEEGKHAEAWRNDKWFLAALDKVGAAAKEISTPLRYTHYLFFNPLGDRIAPGNDAFNEPLGWPGDKRYQQNPIVEVSHPIGHFGDPYLGLAMIWVQDCYPFVHTGYVEQFLWRHGLSRREFAPRLAIKGLQMLMREVPVARPDNSGYWDLLRGWAEQGLSWM